MRAKMIINRLDDWFQIEDVELNTCSLSINILERLTKRPIQGFIYDRVQLAYEILNRKSSESIKAIDNAICVLISRNLIVFEEKNYGQQKIMITELGKEAFKEYEELMK